MPHLSKLRKIDSSDLPLLLSLYSTFGGTTGKTFLEMSPSFSNYLTVCVNILFEIPSIFFCNIPDRKPPSNK